MIFMKQIRTTLTLDMDISFYDDAAEATLKNELAAALGVSTAEIELSLVKSGSVVLEALISTPDSATASRVVSWLATHSASPASHASAFSVTVTASPPIVSEILVSAPPPPASPPPPPPAGPPPPKPPLAPPSVDDDEIIIFGLTLALTTLIYIGAAIGVVAVLIIVLIIFCCCRYSAKSRKQRLQRHASYVTGQGQGQPVMNHYQVPMGQPIPYQVPHPQRTQQAAAV